MFLLTEKMKIYKTAQNEMPNIWPVVDFVILGYNKS